MASPTYDAAGLRNGLADLRATGPLAESNAVFLPCRTIFPRHDTAHIARMILMLGN